MSATPKPIPKVTPDLAPFFAAAKHHQLVVQKCKGCGAMRFPPRELCSSCWSREAEWVEVSGRGEVFSFYVMHQVYHPGFAAEVPYPVAVIQLDDGPRMTSNLVGCRREEIRVGLPVEVVFEDLSEEVALPKFRPRRDS